MIKNTEPQERFTKMSIAELLTQYPQTREVFFSHFGASCFNCPGAHEETVEMGVRVHSADREVFFNDLMKAILATPPEHE